MLFQLKIELEKLLLRKIQKLSLQTEWEDFKMTFKIMIRLRKLERFKKSFNSKDLRKSNKGFKKTHIQQNGTYSEVSFINQMMKT